VAPFPYGRQFDVVKTVPVTTMTIDAICDREGLWIDVLKLDIQGPETDALKKPRARSLAVSRLKPRWEFNPIYQGQPCSPRSIRSSEHRALRCSDSGETTGDA
jgi:hypothetical protein